MTEREKRQEKSSQDEGDAAADFVRDFAETPPAKSIETVKAASGAVEKADKEKREARVRRRAYELWEEHGRPDGRQQEFWRIADAEIEHEKE